MFRRYADDGATIADLARWMAGQGVPTRTGKSRWDRSVIWGMLRNPAYQGRAVFGKTQIIHEQPGLNRVAAAPTRHKSSDEDGQQVWTMNTCGGLARPGSGSPPGGGADGRNPAIQWPLTAGKPAQRRRARPVSLAVISLSRAVPGRGAGSSSRAG